MRVAIVTISDSAVAGTREDRSGPALKQRVEELGWPVVFVGLLPDDAERIASTVRHLADAGETDVVLTTGGTGIAPRDITPEATRTVIEREIPGVAELLRSEGLKKTPFAVLSRAVVGSRGRTLIMNFPGSPSGAVESLDAVMHLIPHMVDLLNGKTEHTGTAGVAKQKLP